MVEMPLIEFTLDVVADGKQRGILRCQIAHQLAKARPERRSGHTRARQSILLDEIVQFTRHTETPKRQLDPFTSSIVPDDPSGSRVYAGGHETAQGSRLRVDHVRASVSRRGGNVAHERHDIERCRAHATGSGGQSAPGQQGGRQQNHDTKTIHDASSASRIISSSNQRSSALSKLTLDPSEFFAGFGECCRILSV